MGDAGKMLKGLGLYLQAARNSSRVVWSLQASDSLGGKTRPLDKQAVCPPWVRPASASIMAVPPEQGRPELQHC